MGYHTAVNVRRRFLCFEGVEKLAQKYLHAEQAEEHKKEKQEALADPAIDLVKFEKAKIKGAIRTDFILSAEIIVISLGIVADSTLSTQISVLVLISIAMTLGVYGLVAGLVKIDDLGLHLLNKPNASNIQRRVGQALLLAAPKIMKFLTVAGTLAMFLVGGGIIAHGIAPVHHLFEHWQEILLAGQPWFSWLGHPLTFFLNALLGLASGTALVLAFELFNKARPSAHS